jgi:hypothetical protein
MTVDGGTETGQMYASHEALWYVYMYPRRNLSLTLDYSNAYLPDLDRDLFPTFVSIPSTDNISIESVWSYWLKAKGLTIKETIISGRDKGYYITGNRLHACVAYHLFFYW